MKKFKKNVVNYLTQEGTYLPPADALLSMSELFSVSINEILSGKRLRTEEYREAAEENLQKAIRESSFTVQERMEFFKKKWLKDHWVDLLLIGLVIIAVYVTGFILRDSFIGLVAVLLLVLAHGWRNNTMMAYVEGHVFGKPSK